MKMSKLGIPVFAALAACISAALLWPAPARAAGLELSPAARHGIDLLYSGQTDKAIEQFREIQAAQPDHPLGYILEADARWWQIFCEACEIKWNMLDAWQRPRLAGDNAFLELAGKITALAVARIAKEDTAEMELYAGIGWMLRARLLALRDDRRGTATAGVKARAYMLRCLEMDPQMADAYTGLGLYNYFVDTLSVIAKVLRFFMGIPGGDKRDGVRQLETAMQRGVLTRVEARFYLAKNLRNYDQKYAESVDVMAPLVAEFPQNPVFQLILGDTQAKLNRKALAETSYRAAASITVSNTVCAERIRVLVEQALAVLGGGVAQTGR